MTLTDFLLARIAEDEAAAQDALLPTHYPQFGDNAASATLGLMESEGADATGVAHFDRHDPARVLAECEAKRRIVDNATNMHTSGVDWDEAVRLLASPYADHPDYREEWKP